LCSEREGHLVGGETGERPTHPAQSETPGTLGNCMRENRETPRVSGRSTPDGREKATSSTTSRHARGESDEPVVPAKRSNQCPERVSLFGVPLVEPLPSRRSNLRRRVWDGNACPRDSEVCGKPPAGTSSSGSPRCCTRGPSIGSETATTYARGKLRREWTE